MFLYVDACIVLPEAKTQLASAEHGSVPLLVALQDRDIRTYVRDVKQPQPMYCVDPEIATGPTCIDGTMCAVACPCRPQSFVDSMVVFVNRRIGALVEVLSPKDAACALARRLRCHVRAHDAFTAALRIRAGRKRAPENGVDCSDQSRGEDANNEEGAAREGDGDEGVEEHDVQASFAKGWLRPRRMYM